MPKIHEYDIVQVVDETHKWYPCLIIVTEVRDWGIQGYVTVPYKGDTYIRLKYEEVERVGAASVVRDNEDNTVHTCKPDPRLKSYRLGRLKE